jgi:signal transduction histidine kinase
VDALKQILVNLIKNAVEALPKGGSIAIINAGRVQREGRQFIALSVQDNGPGVPPEVLAKLFTPVKSSKPGENRGIGLSIVQGLVQKLKGQIGCTSTDRGTVFEILLPARMAALQRAVPEPFRNEA